MGPQLDSCGRLQAGKQSTDVIWASMGPQLDSCGRVSHPTRVTRPRQTASMGPQLDSCGRGVELARALKAARWLQWGRNLIVAEGDVGGLQALVERTLQWGRNLIVAEGSLDSWPAPTNRSLQWGRNLIVAEGRGPAPDILFVTCASMGPQLDSCGRRNIQRHQSGSRWCFNGAAT